MPTPDSLELAPMSLKNHHMIWIDLIAVILLDPF